jgi:hypothetical protein
MKGEDPDSMKSVMADVGDSLKEAMEMVRSKAVELGVDIDNLDDVEEKRPPKPKEFELYRKLQTWQKQVLALVRKADAKNESWLQTEAGLDLAWYMTTILVKTYRQLCTLWEIEHGDEYMELEAAYTYYVLVECCGILQKALLDLHKQNTTRKLEFMFLSDGFELLTKEIISLKS